MRKITRGNGNIAPSVYSGGTMAGKSCKLESLNTCLKA